MGKQRKQWLTLFFWAPKSLQIVIAAMKLRHLLLGKKVMTNLDSILKRDITLPTKVRLVKVMGFSSGRVWMWELDCKESWAPNYWCFWTVVLEKTLQSPLECKEIQLVHPEGDQSWVFIGRTDVEAETPILWPPDTKSWLIGKDPDAGKDWGQEEKGMTEDEMVGWHHRLNGHGFGCTPRVGDGQGGLACCSSWGRKASDMTEQLNWTEVVSNFSKTRFIHIFRTGNWKQARKEHLWQKPFQEVWLEWWGNKWRYTLENFGYVFMWDFFLMG